MARFAVTKDIPVTTFVEAEDEVEALDKVDFTPAWDILYGRHDENADELSNVGFVLGFPYDDIDVQERDDEDIPVGIVEHANRD